MPNDAAQQRCVAMRRPWMTNESRPIFTTREKWLVSIPLSAGPPGFICSIIINNCSTFACLTARLYFIIDTGDLFNLWLRQNRAMAF